MHPIIRKAIPHLLAIVSFVVLISAYFYPQFQGKSLSQSDITQWRGFSQEAREYREQEGREILWTNAIFIGMPTNFVQLAHPNTLEFFRSLSKLYFSRPISFFTGFFVCAYILFVCLRVPPLVSFIGASMIALSTNNLILMEAGHNTKVETLAYTSLIIAGFLLAVRRAYIWGGILFAIGLGLSIHGDHIQMTYYLGICMLIGVIAYLIKYIREKDYSHIGKVAGVLGLAALLALGSNVSRLWTNYELAQETMRGKPILSEVSAREAGSSSETDGLAWDYAMAWSNGWLDNFALLIPGVVGGGSGEKAGPGSASYDALRRGGVSPQADGNYMLPMYWGALPFTSGPIYAGAIVCFLFVLGMFLLKGPLRWWLGISVLLTVLLAMGRNFEVLSALFFDYFPLFSKFRTPNSILSITVLLMPIPGILALKAILSEKAARDEIRKALMYAAGITGGICLFFAIAGPQMFDFIGQSDQQVSQSGIYDLIIQDRQWWMQSDALRSLVLIVLSAGLIWLSVMGNIRQQLMLLGIAALAIWDIMSVNLRYVHPNDFMAADPIATFFSMRPVDRQILDNEPHRGAYRVLDLSINTFNSSRASYYHNTIGGYHAAKLQRIQDLIDHHISRNNQQVLNMLNTKYIINREEQLSVNPEALGNVWLVNEIITVNTPQEEIDALQTLDTRTTAVVLDNEFDNYVGSFSPSGEGSIRLTHYIPDHWTYQYSSDSEQFAVFSEAWFGTGGGLKAYIDGQQVPFVRANYALRGLKLPAGEHTIEFKFLPRSYVTGSVITRFSSLLLVLGTLGWLGYTVYTNRKKLMEAPAVIAEKPEAPAAKQSGKPRRKKR